ncbi:MAG: hypothetical protein ACD_23C01190G0001, partial [uncultured bacterium]
MNTTSAKHLSFRRETLALLLVSLLATTVSLSSPAAAGERLT